MNIASRLFYFIFFSVFLAIQADAQDMSAWSDERVCQYQSGFNDEVYIRSLNCKALNVPNRGNALSVVRSSDITFPGNFYTDEIKSCQVSNAG